MNYGRVERVKMVYSMKEHRKTITDITISNDNENCISSSVDGSCISWFLEGKNGGKRDGAIFANTEFCAIQYYPDMSQFLTVGTDRKVSYWDSAPSEKTAIREIQASDEGILGGPLRALDIDTDGAIFGTGGDDKLVKVWTYDEGNLEAVGIGHSQSVLGLKIAPGSNTMISVGSEGAIMIWTL